MFIPRPGFRESEVLADYMASHMQALAVSEGAFRSGEWIAALDTLAGMPRGKRNRENRAHVAARFLIDRLVDSGHSPGPESSGR